MTTGQCPQGWSRGSENYHQQRELWQRVLACPTLASWTAMASTLGKVGSSMWRRRRPMRAPLLMGPTTVRASCAMRIKEYTAQWERGLSFPDGLVTTPRRTWAPLAAQQQQRPAAPAAQTVLVLALLLASAPLAWSGATCLAASLGGMTGGCGRSTRLAGGLLCRPGPRPARCRLAEA